MFDTNTTDEHGATQYIRKDDLDSNDLDDNDLYGDEKYCACTETDIDPEDIIEDSFVDGEHKQRVIGQYCNNCHKEIENDEENTEAERREEAEGDYGMDRF